MNNTAEPTPGPTSVAPTLTALDAIRVVLVETSHPGNIGAAARAMKTMGLSELTLVSPAGFPSAPATARAAGADDILYHARVVPTLAEAIADCSWAVATTARRRELSVPVHTPRELAPHVLTRSAHGTVALVFGRESSGLNNTEVLQCQAAVEIPANAAYASLNLAAAVQVLAYELRVTALAGETSASSVDPSQRLAGVADLEGLYAHLEQAAIAVGYLDPARPKKLMARLRALFARTGLTASELQILRGLLSAAETSAKASESTAGPGAQPSVDPPSTG